MLSQWWPAAFEIGGVHYDHAEGYLMAEKTRLFGDHATCAAILAATHPGEAKRLGRHVTGFDEEAWATHRVNIAIAANRAKFGQHADLAAYLASTRGRVLVEASPVDRFWGVGLTADDRSITRPSHWKGANLLGFALMTVRDTDR